MDTTGKAENRIRPALALWGYLRGARWILAGLLTLELVANATALVEPLVARWVLEELRNPRGVVGPALVLVGTAAIGLVLAWVSTFLLERTAQRIVLNVRRNMVSRLIRTRVDVVEQHPTGDFLSRMGSDTILLEDTATGPVVDAASAPLALAAALVLMATIDPVLLGLVVVSLVITALAERRALRRVGEATEDAQEHVGRMIGALQRVLTAFRTVKASGTEGPEERAVSSEAELAYRAGVRGARAEATVEVVSMAAVDVTFLVVLAVGAAEVASGRLSLGDLVAFLLYVVYLGDPIEDISDAATSLSEGMAAVKRVEELRALPPEREPHQPDQATTRVPAPVRGIRFEQVRFGYPSRPVLRDVTTEIGVGLTVLTGPSGAGKTTMLSLIERFTDVDRGRITLGEVDLRNIDREELRRRLAYVQQEAPLLGETIRAAALYGVPDPERADLDGVLQAVALDEWVATLPDGLETIVGERGVAISGGQRQRLAVARALLRGAEVLLLDEATSQLDAATERTLLRTISDQARTRIVIAVTHRLSVAAHANQVVLLVDGQVRAAGRHAELLRTNALYRKFALLDGTSIDATAFTARS